MFITIPKIYGTLFPEYDRYCGRPVRLIMSVYGTTLCGKYWYLVLLLEYLLELGFRASAESIWFLLVYYFGSPFWVCLIPEYSGV
jgi:hypothetical protein